MFVTFCVVADCAKGFPEVQRAVGCDKCCTKEVKMHGSVMGPMFSTERRICLAG